MGQVRHGSATTTHAVRAALQRSQASTAELSREIGINPKTVAEWRKRRSVEDRKTGPKEPRSTVLSEGEEAMIVALSSVSNPCPVSCSTGHPLGEGFILFGAGGPVAPPLHHARWRNSKPRRGLAVARASRHRPQNLNAKIKAKRSRHVCQPPVPADSVNHNSSRLGIPNRSNPLGANT